MRLTLVSLNYSPEPTGIAVYSTAVAEGLTNVGHDVHVLTGYPHYPEWKIREGYRGSRGTEEINSVRVERFRHSVPRRPRAISRILMEVTFALSLLRADFKKSDFIVCVSPSLFSAAAVLLRQLILNNGVPVAVWVQDIYTAGVVETKSLGKTFAIFTRLVERFVMRRATTVIVIHERFADYLQREFGVSPERIACIRNWTHAKPVEAVAKESVRARYGWSADDVVVLHAGNMGAKQCLDNVVDAAFIADSQGSRVRFVLLGDGNQRERLQSRALGAGRIEFIDPLSSREFAEILQAVEILLVNEGTGVVDMAVPSKLTTYFASGKPVVAATENRSVTALEVRESGGGLRVEPGRPIELLSAVEKLADDPALCRLMGDAGKRYSTRLLSSDEAISKFDSLLSAGAAQLRAKV